MTQREERAYIEGQKCIHRRNLNEAPRYLGKSDSEAGKARWASERTAVVAYLRNLCADYGDVEWGDDLHLEDVIEKHLWRHVEPLLPPPEDADEP